MAFVPVPAPKLELTNDVTQGDVITPSFSRRTYLKGATANLLSNAAALTMVGNLLTIPAPVRNYDLATFAGIGLSLQTTIVAGNAPSVAARDVVVYNVASTGHTYTYPSARQTGQLMLMVIATAALTTISTPSGWTLVQTQAGTESRTAVYSRVVTGLEPSTELIAFGTASGCVVRTWCIDIGDAPVEATAGLNDSAAGTSLDLATVTPTWAVAEPTSNLYIAVLGLANDLTVSGFPAGYTVTGQDVSASATANIDCTLAYAERSALGSSENPGAFTYPASRSTGHIIAIKPMVTGRVNWDGLGVLKNAVAVGTRRGLNLVEGANVALTITDDAGNDRVNATIAYSGVVGHVIRDDGVGMTQRAALNFTSSSTINAVLVDDAGNNETEAGFAIVADSVSNTLLSNMAANTIKANPTAGSADPQDFGVVAESVVGRTSGNIINITSVAQSILMRSSGSVFWGTAAADQVLRRSGSGDLGFGTLVTNNIGDDQVTFPKIVDIATARILGRVTAGTGDVEALTGTQATTLLDVFTSALKGLAPASGGGTVNFLRADGTWQAPVAAMPTINPGEMLGLQVDAGGAAAAIAITGAEQGENIRYTTSVTDAISAGSTATYAIANTTTQIRFTSGTGVRILHGFTASAATFGKRVIIEVESGVTGFVQIPNESGSAGVSTERVRTPSGATITLSANQRLTMVYFDNRWRVEAVGNGGVEIRNNGLTMTVRPVLNFIDTSTITFIPADDPGATEIEMRFHVDQGANFNWTGNHSFTSATLTASVSGDISLNSTGDDLLLSAAVGSVSLSAGAGPETALSNGIMSLFSTGDILLRSTSIGLYTGSLATTVNNVDGGDIVINATGGIAIICDPLSGVPTLGATNGFVTIGGLHDISIYTTNGGISLSTDTSLIEAAPNGQILFNASQNFRVVLATTERFEIVGSTGAWQVSGANGSDGQVLTSHGSSASPAWETPVDHPEDVSLEDFQFGYALSGAFFSTWRWEVIGTGSKQPVRVAGRRGVFQIFSSVPSESVCGLSAGFTLSGLQGDTVPIANVSALRFIVRVADVAAVTTELANANYGVGLVTTATVAELDGGSPTLGTNGIIILKTTASAAWQGYRRTAGVQLMNSTGINAVVGTWITFDLVNNGGGSWAISVNGTFAVNLTGCPTTGDFVPVVWLDNNDAGLNDDKNFQIDVFEIRYSGR